MNGGPVAISSSGEFRDVVRESFSWPGAVIAPPPTTVTVPAATMETDLPRFTVILDPSVTVPAATMETDLPRFTMISDSVGDGTCCGYGDGSAAFYATVDDYNVLIYVRKPVC
jgi:hypothetical protein